MKNDTRLHMKIDQIQFDEFISELKEGIKGEVRFDKITRAMHSTDASVYQIFPAGVVIPRTPRDVEYTVKTCRMFGISITCRGGGSSQAGQAIGSGIVLDFSKYMNGVIQFDEEELTVTLQPGIVLDNLNDMLKPHGVFLPLDLSSSNRATIGGMIANNAGGARSIIYGKTIDYVEEVEVILSDGSVVRFKKESGEDFLAKCGTEDLAGDCYRAVRDLASEHAEEIDLRYPKIMRRVGGYNLDDFVPPRDEYNMARIMTGSEGTLGVITEAKMRLVPLQNIRTTCVVHFDHLPEAMKAVPAILEHKPSAIELSDKFILDNTKGNTEYEPLRSFITGDPGAILIVEFFGENEEELPGKVDRLEADLKSKELGYHIYRTVDAADQARVWKLRKAALGLTMAVTGDTKAIPFVEDTAVDPAKLHDYIVRFLEILRENDTEAGFYAHASVGLLHIRPIVNMKTSVGVERFRNIATKVSDLVLEFGGALSGEHGDGLSRSPFQEKMFGPVLYEAFKELKRTFDPDNIFNPGKIVEAPGLTENLKFGGGYIDNRVDSRFDFSDFGGLSRAADQCSGVGKCRKDLIGAMCPSFMATRDEADSTRGRANALRLAISGDLGPEGFTDDELRQALELCIQCKSCKTECPTGVDMARMKSEYLYQYQRKNGFSLRSRMLAHADEVGRIGSMFAAPVNRFAETKAGRYLLEKLLNIDSRRILPKFAAKTFYDWWDENSTHNGNLSKGTVAIFADTFTDYYDPSSGIAAVQLAQHFGYEVIIPPKSCCGRTLISKGLLDEAIEYAENTVNALYPIAEQGIPVIFCEPGCYSAVTDDHRYLLKDELREKSERIAEMSLLFEQWAAGIFKDSGGNGQLFGQGPAKILYHAHCHQEALIGTGPVSKLLSMIPGSEVEILDSGCCGMAGSFGYEKEHYDVSESIAELRLLQAVRKAGPDSVIIAPGFSCRSQLKHFEDVNAETTMSFLLSLLEPNEKSGQ